MRNRCYEIGWDVASVLLTVLSVLVRLVLLRVCKRSHYSRVSDVYGIAQRSNENSKESNALKHGFIA